MKPRTSEMGRISKSMAMRKRDKAGSHDPVRSLAWLLIHRADDVEDSVVRAESLLFLPAG